MLLIKIKGAANVRYLHYKTKENHQFSAQSIIVVQPHPISLEPSLSWITVAPNLS
jgi:hypothetical protein